MPAPVPVKWAKDRKQEFLDWIEEELNNTISDRGPLENKWIDYMVQWRSALPTEEAQHPWPGASNIEFPLTPIHADPVYADFMQSLHIPEDYWTPVAKRPDRVMHANSLREFMTALDRNVLNLRSVNERAILDLVVLGTAVWKNHTVTERKSRVHSADEKRLHSRTIPRIEHVPLQHFYIPAYAWNIDPDAPVGAAPWVAQKFFLSKSQLRARGFDKDVTETIERWVNDTIIAPVDDHIRAADEYVPWKNEKAELFEIWVRFDTDGDGYDEDLVVTLHLPSLTIVQAQYADTVLKHGKRPFHSCVYLPGFGFYGQGIAEIDEWAQSVLTMLSNHAVNNVVLANTRMFAAPQGSSLIPGEPVWPGRVVTVPPGEKIGEIKLGEVYQSLPQMIQFFMQIAEMRTAVTELRQGNMNSLPGRTPATTVLSVLREGSKRFDMILAHVRDRHNPMGLHMLQNVAQLYADSPEVWMALCVDYVGEDDAQRVIEILSEGPSVIEDSYGINVSATSALVNKESEKQGFVGMMQTIIPMYQQLVQTAVLAEQQLPPGSLGRETALMSYRAGLELITQLLQKFDVQNPSEYVGDLHNLIDQIDPPGGQAPAQGAGPAGIPYSPFPGAQQQGAGGMDIGALLGLGA